MAITGNFARLRRVRDQFRSMARPDGSAQKTLLRGVKQQVAIVLRNEFRTSTDPSGSEWQRTVSGQAALNSKKLATAFDLAVVDGAVKGIGKSARDMLTAHQEGHTFAARHVAANKQFLSFNRRGRLVKNSRVLNKKGEVKRGMFQTFARAHQVGRRVLPARPIIPTGSELPAAWDAAVKAGIYVGMRWWQERMER